MKKLALAAAIAATTSVGAQATTYNISSTLTGSQLIFASDDQSSNTMVFGGTVEIDGVGAGNAWTVSAAQGGAVATLTGTQSITTGTTDLNYNLPGSSSANGIIFDNGNIDIIAGGTPYGTVDASVDNIRFDNGSTWQTLPIGGIDMSGGTINGDGTITIAFNGLWTGPQPMGYLDGPAAATQATGGATLFSSDALIYLEGELTLSVSEIPVPAAIWLFGSALLGLAGIRQKLRG